MSRPQVPETLIEAAQQLGEVGSFLYLSGCSAIDHLLGRDPGRILECATDASLTALAPLGDLSFLGTEGIDAVLEVGELQLIIHLTEKEVLSVSPIRMLEFFFDPLERKFLDPRGQYFAIRERTVSQEGIDEQGFRGWHDICDLALLAARYGCTVPEYRLARLPEPVSEEYQRLLLMRLLESRDTAAGLRYLQEIGFVSSHWELLASMVGVEQDKDFHPEGDVWDHTLEMFSYSKGNELELQLAILLHDCGKAFASRQDNNRFNRHAQIGADRAGRFLQELSFDTGLREKVHFLIRNHMVPSYAHRLPSHRIDDILRSPDYPQVLELFRCDISSSYRSMDTYYRACDHYRQYMKQARNPYRGKRRDTYRVEQTS